MSNNFDKSAILDSFLDEVTSYLPEIEANLDRLQQRPDDAETIEETYRRTHTIAGSAAMMDFDALAHVAQGMEDILGGVIDRRATLDAPTIGLLRRSATRLTRLVDNIRTGAENTSIVQEDDADRAASRGTAAPATPQTDWSSASPAAPTPSQPFSASGFTNPQPASAATQQGPAGLPDWLAAFANPTSDLPPVSAGLPNGSNGPLPPGGAASPGRMPSNIVPPWDDAPGAESMDDILRAFTTQANDSTPELGGGGRWASGPLPPLSQPIGPTGPMPRVGWSAMPPSRPDLTQMGTSALPAVGTPAGLPPGSRGDLSSHAATGSVGNQDVFADLRADEESVRRQVGSLQAVIAELRAATQSMEDERSELRGFLDGSRDALERLEDWAGQQMGLDLRQSPESVRRYLPLSVIWVTTTRLKRLVGLLTTSGRNLTATQEQIEETLNDLRGAIDGAGTIYRSIASVGNAPDRGFQATVAQISWAPTAPPTTPDQAPTWSGGSASQPATDAISPGARAEIERELREQLRRELEDEVRTEVAAEVRGEEEQRIRQELQIQVRRQLLAELTPSLGAAANPTGELGFSKAPALPFMGERVAAPVQVTNELSPEALEVFREEAQEHLLTITTGIAGLEVNPSDASALQSVRRATHTLKGAAGMMGFSAIQQLAHASEDLLDRLVEGSIALTPDLVGLLLDTADTLDQLARGLLSGDIDQQQAQQTLIDRFARATGKTIAPAASPSASTQQRGDAIAVTTADDEDQGGNQPGASEKSDLSVRLQLSKLDDLVNLFGELLVNRSVLEERIERLGRMVSDSAVVGEHLRDVGAQLETRFEAATLPSGRAGQNGTANRNGAPGWAANGAGPNGGRPEQNGANHDFDELEMDRYTEFHRLSRGLGEGVADIVTLSHEMESLIREVLASFSRENRLSSDFQDRLLRARLVPLQSLMPRLYRAARTSAAHEGKEIEFFTEGADIEVDRKVFEDVSGPLVHMVRNAVNHAIERPEVRERAGKRRTGSITVSTSYEGNLVVIAVRDDGAGIDPESVRQKAIARGWIDSYTPLPEKDAYNLIFRQGFSTASSVTEESGRGVGLDVVRDAVTRLRGTIEVESKVGQGTTFTMKFPISLQIARAVLLKVGSSTYAIPMAVVEQIGRLDYYTRSSTDALTIEMHGERYRLAHLGQYLHVPYAPVEERASVLLVNAGKRRVALLVDGIVAQQEIVSKPLGPHLRDVRGVAGAAVLGNGQVVVIVELLELLADEPRGVLVLPTPGVRQPAPGATSQPGAPAARIPTVAAASPSSPAASYPAGVPSTPSLPTASVEAPGTRGGFVVTRSPQDASGLHMVTQPPVVRTGHVLVVDDSPSVRRVVSGMLKSHGWEVQTARDGVEALEAIARQAPVAVLLDIEMPRMDGYELMATIRSQPQYRHLPLIVLTSRSAAKHQQRASQLGADDYVVKPYQDDELLAKIDALIRSKSAS